MYLSIPHHRAVPRSMHSADSQPARRSVQGGAIPTQLAHTSALSNIAQDVHWFRLNVHRRRRAPGCDSTP
eukprot:27354-Eustigmatos_ZCMA.PRE.1